MHRRSFNSDNFPFARLAVGLMDLAGGAFAKGDAAVVEPSLESQGKSGQRIVVQIASDRRGIDQRSSSTL